MRYTRIDLEGRVGYYATMHRQHGSDSIQVDILCPDLERTHHVQAGPDDRIDQHSMAECLQETLEGYSGGEVAIGNYYDAIIRLAD